MFLIKLVQKFALTYIIAVILFLPITGIILDDYKLVFHLQRPFILATIMTFIYMIYTLVKNSNLKINYAQLNLNSLINFKESIKTQIYANQQFISIGKILFFGCLILLPFAISKYTISVLILAMIYVLLGLGLNIVVGYAGLLDLGYVAFYAIGAYTYAIGTQYFDLSFFTTIPLAALIAGFAGTILAFPVLRMHGDYLAIVTLGFGEIIRLVLNNWVSMTNGPNGIITNNPSIFNIEFSRVASEGHIPFHSYFNMAYNSQLKYIFIYLVLLFCLALVITFAKKVKAMPLGRAWEALREDEIASNSLGIYHITTKLSAFSIGASIGGIGGVFFAAYQGFVNPSSFTFFESALILAIVVLGGMGSILGVILAALTLTILPEVLREAANYRMLFFGLIMIVIMIYKPQGFIKPKRPVFNIDK